MNSTLFSPHASMQRAIVERYVYERQPTSCKSNTSASRPCSMAGVGLRVVPKSENAARPVTGSRREPTDCPASAVPSRPCSGVNSAMRLTPGAWLRMTRSNSPAASVPVWLVTRPMCLPRTAAKPVSRRVSMPRRTDCARRPWARLPNAQRANAASRAGRATGNEQKTRMRAGKERLRAECRAGKQPPEKRAPGRFLFAFAAPLC